MRSAGTGNYVDGNGLMLRVRKSGSRQWIQHLTIHGWRVDLGLGSAELVRLADARKVAADNCAIARTGGDPRRARVPTFEKAEAVCFAEKREIWRSDGPENGWRRAMDRYVLPSIGTMPTDKVGSAARSCRRGLTASWGRGGFRTGRATDRLARRSPAPWRCAACRGGTPAAPLAASNHKTADRRGTDGPLDAAPDPREGRRHSPSPLLLPAQHSRRPPPSTWNDAILPALGHLRLGSIARADVARFFHEYGRCEPLS